MSFRSVLIAVVIAFALVLAAFLSNRARPKSKPISLAADLVTRHRKMRGMSRPHSNIQWCTNTR